MEALYRLELRRHHYPSVSSDARGKFDGGADWMCAWSGSEHLCANMSRKVGNWGTGEVHARLFHSSHLLNATGNSRCTCFVHYSSPPRLSAHLSSIQAFLPTTG